MNSAGHGGIYAAVADRGLLAGAFVVDRGSSRVSALVDPLNSSEQLRIDRLDRGAIDSLNSALYLTLVNLFEYVERAVGDFGAGGPLAVGLGAGLRRRIRGRLLRRG